MQFCPIPCHKSLQPFIRNYWLLTARCTATATHRIYSNGAASLHFYLGQTVKLDGEVREYRTALNKHELGCMEMHTEEGAFVIVGVEFVPFCSQLFFKMQEGVSHLTPEDLGDEEFATLSAKIMEAGTTEERVQLLDEFFCKRLSEISISEVNMERLEEVFEDIVPTDKEAKQEIDFENLSTSDLAETACLSQKQFTRVFSEYVGMRPKAYLRLLRFHKALMELQKAGDNKTLKEIAWECGFYDLAHMNNEFRQLCGHSPSEVVELGSKMTEAFEQGFSGQMKKKVIVENLE